MEIDERPEPANGNRTKDLIETRYNFIVIWLNQRVKKWCVIPVFDNLQTQKWGLAGKVTTSASIFSHNRAGRQKES